MTSQRALVRKRTVVLIDAVIALAFLMGGGTPAARAQSANWNTAVTAGGSWGTPSNWQGGIPSGAGNTAGFLLNFNSGASVTLDGSRTIGTVSSSSGNPWSLDPGTGGTLTVSTFTITGGGPLTVTAAMAGTSLTKGGSGTLVLSSPGSVYTGPVNVNAGTLKLIGSGNYSPGANTVTVASGATLDVTGLTGGGHFGGTGTAFGLNSGDTLTGSGTVNGGINAPSGATVFPGDNGVGSMSVTGSGNFASGSTWQVKLGTANAGGSNTSNRVDFTASLKVDTGVNMPIDGSGLTFVPGQTYDYVIGTSGAANFTIGSVNFQPTNFNPSGFVSQSSFSLVTNGDNLILHITAVPEPPVVTAIALAVAVSSVILRRLLVFTVGR
jgi:autotransporter-associated beta strand protein